MTQKCVPQIMKADATEAGVFQDRQKMSVIQILWLQDCSHFTRKNQIAGNALFAVQKSLEHSLVS